jgi:hypothetical protein
MPVLDAYREERKYSSVPTHVLPVRTGFEQRGSSLNAYRQQSIGKVKDATEMTDSEEQIPYRNHYKWPAQRKQKYLQRGKGTCHLPRWLECSDG